MTRSRGNERKEGRHCLNAIKLSDLKLSLSRWERAGVREKR
jgi:hypothetical protein